MDRKEEKKEEEFQTVVHHTWSFQVTYDSKFNLQPASSNFSPKVCLANQYHVLHFELKMIPFSNTDDASLKLTLKNKMYLWAKVTLHKIMADRTRRLLFDDSVAFAPSALTVAIMPRLFTVPDYLTLVIKLDFSRDAPLDLPDVSESATLVGTLDKLYFGPDQTTTFSDVELVCENRHFKCHKFILAARSKVFATMFLQPMKEQLTNVVDIKDAKPEALEKFISLVLVCQKLICSRIDMMNVWKAFELANIVNAPQLDSFVRKFIAYHAKELKNFPEWNTMLTLNPDLMMEVLNSLL